MKVEGLTHSIKWMSMPSNLLTSNLLTSNLLISNLLTSNLNSGSAWAIFPPMTSISVPGRNHGHVLPAAGGGGLKFELPGV